MTTIEELRAEFEAFEARRESVEADHGGQFVVFHDARFEGAHPAFHEARRFPRGSSPPRRHIGSVPLAAALVATLLVGLFVAFAASSEDELLNSRAAELIRHLQDDLPSIRETIRKLDEAPESGMFVIWDKGSYQDDLNGHLDDALAILLPESYRLTRETLQEIDESPEELRTEESKLEAETALEAIRPSDEPGVVGRVVDWLTDEDIDDRTRDLRAKTIEPGTKARTASRGLSRAGERRIWS